MWKSQACNSSAGSLHLGGHLAKPPEKVLPVRGSLKKKKERAPEERHPNLSLWPVCVRSCTHRCIYLKKDEGEVVMLTVHWRDYFYTVCN